MTLNEALEQIGGFLGIDPKELIQYAAQDSIGGYHTDPAVAKFPCGSLWDSEGRALFAVARALKPVDVLELGVFAGASTNHLRAGHTQGWVTSIDIWEGAGSLIYPHLNNGELFYMDGVEYLRGVPDDAIDLAFEDMNHNTEQVMQVCELLLRKLAPGGVCIHHDSEHPTAGHVVREGVRRAGITNTLSLVFGGSDCGLLFWRRP